MLVGDIYAPGKVRLVERPEPVLPPSPPEGCSGQIIFQPETTCLCGSDRPFFLHAGEWPVEMGHSLHEMIGTVIATNGKRWKPGDRILAVPVFQVGLAERFILDENRSIPIATNVPEDEALMAQPLGTAIYAMKKLQTVLDKDVVIIGQGPMGQLMNACCRNLGAREIIGVDLLESRLKTSAKMGATHTICNKTTDPVAAVQKILDGELADIVIECVGHADQAFNLAIELCKKKGQILFFGVPGPVVNELRWRDLFRKNITVHTSVDPDFGRDFPLAMRWISEGRINVKPLITHRYPLSELQTAFETFCDRKDGAIKVIVDFPAKKS